MSNWQTLSSTPILDGGKWLSVEDRTVVTPAGQIIEHWHWVTTPNYVNVLGVTPEGRYLVFRQGKYGLDGKSLAPVGGYMEPGEEPLQAARRELLEETGHEADEWISLGQYLVDPSRGCCNRQPLPGPRRSPRGAYHRRRPGRAAPPLPHPRRARRSPARRAVQSAGLGCQHRTCSTP